jgi:hypothetical protein
MRTPDHLACVSLLPSSGKPKETIMLKRIAAIAGLTLVLGIVVVPSAHADTRFSIQIGPGYWSNAPGYYWQDGYDAWTGYGHRSYRGRDWADRRWERDRRHDDRNWGGRRPDRDGDWNRGHDRYRDDDRSRRRDHDGDRHRDDDRDRYRRDGGGRR